MEKTRVDSTIMALKSKVLKKEIPYIREKLIRANESAVQGITYAKYKKPATVIILSLLFGWLGLDRFYLKKFGTGILKFLLGAITALATLSVFFSTKFVEILTSFKITVSSSDTIVYYVAIGALVAGAIYAIWYIFDILRASGRAKSRNLKVVHKKINAAGIAPIANYTAIPVQVVAPSQVLITVKK